MGLPKNLIFAGVSFTHAGDIVPRRDSSGVVIAYSPQSRYSKASTASLHSHGIGPFCRFAIAALPHASAVYLIVVDGAPMYVGETVDLCERFGARGYGAIQPRNCFGGGQPTNCKVNNKIYAAACAGSSIALYVRYTTDHKRVEAQIRAAIRLPWNGV